MSLLLKISREKQIRYAMLTLFAVFWGTIFWLANLSDPPIDYSASNVDILEKQIKRHEADILSYGDGASALDGDRYWPLDRDRTVLGLFLFREQNDRWPISWDELLATDLLDDKSSIHQNWNLITSGDDWEIILNGNRKIAFFKMVGAKIAADGPPPIGIHLHLGDNANEKPAT